MSVNLTQFAKKIRAIGGLQCAIECDRRGCYTRQLTGRVGAREQYRLNRGGFVSRLDLGKATLFYTRIAKSIEIQSKGVTDFFYLQVQLNGSLRCQLGEKSFRLVPGDGIAVCPGTPFRLTISDSCEQLILRVDRLEFERQMELHTRKTLKTASVFDRQFRLLAAMNRELVRLLLCIASVVSQGGNFLESEMVKRELSSLLAATLVESVDRSSRCPRLQAASGFNNANIAYSAPEFLVKAVSFLKANFTEPLGLADVVRVAGVSQRTLYNGFKRHLATTPMRFVKEMRLQHARSHLSRKRAAGQSVTEIAFAAGYSHLGRFATDYKQKYGERPSDTLRGSLS